METVFHAICTPPSANSVRACVCVYECERQRDIERKRGGGGGERERSTGLPLNLVLYMSFSIFGYSLKFCLSPFHVTNAFPE
jgi:hypothetical protein